MSVYKIASKWLACFYLLISVGTGYAELLSSKRNVLIAKRKNIIKRKSGNLPNWKPAFQKTKTKKKALLQYAKPPSESKLYFDEGTDEAELEKITLLEIQQLYQLLKTSNRPDIRLRLASLYAEQSRLIESRLHEVYSKELEKYKSKQRNTLPKLNLTSARNYSKKAVNLFTSYIQQYPNSKRADEILFQLGYSYFQLGKPKQGKEYYEQLVRRFPKSDYLEDTFFHLGQYYFDQNQWKTSRNYYDKASRFRSKFYFFSIYKISWCLYNEGRVELAMNAMKRIIKESTKDNKINPVDFSYEALSDLASFYVYSKYPAKKAYSYLKSFSSNKERLGQLLEKIANAYRDIGSNQSMRIVFNRLIQLNPYQPKAYEYKYQIVQVYSHTREKKIFNQEFTDWIRNYSKGSLWSRKNKSDKDLLKKADSLMELTLRHYAFRMHHLFLKTNKDYEKKQSLFAYQFYMEYFKHSKFYPDVVFHYGEILFDVNQLEKAIQQYDLIANKYPKSKNYEIAVLNRILALERLIPSEKEISKSVRSKSSQSIVIPEVVKKFSMAVVSYYRQFSKKDNVPNMLYTLAKIYSEYKQHQLAIRYWMIIVDQYPKSNASLVSQSVHFILDTYNVLKDFKNLEHHARLFLKIPEVKKLEISKDVRQILTQIEFKKAQDLAQSGDLKESATLYESFYQSNPRHSLSTIALYNAAINYKKTNQIAKAVRLYSTLSQLRNLNKKPKIKLAVMQDLPHLHQKQGLYWKAATGFKNYAIQYPKNKEVGKYWYNAGFIFDGMNLYKEAVSAYMRYFTVTRSIEKNQVYFLIARMRERQNQIPKAIGNYLKYVNQPDKNTLTQVMALFKIAELNERLNRKKTAMEWYQKTIRAYDKFNKGVKFAAEAQFKKTYQTYLQLKSIRIPSNPSQQAKAIQKKLSILEKLKTDTKKIIQFDYGPKIIAILTIMGLSNRHVGESILKAPIPKGLDRETRKQYKQGLKQTAEPFIQSSKQYLEQAISKSKKTEGYVRWLKEARKALSPSMYKENTLSITLMGIP